MRDNIAPDRLEIVRRQLRQFVAERDWQQFHDPKNLAMAVASEAGELLAELRWVTTEHADAYTHEAPNRERIEREIGDIGIVLLLFCDRTGIDLLTAIEQKLALNADNYPVSLSKGRSSRPERGV